MTVEKPVGSSHVWVLNAVDQPVDVYVNHAADPTITDVKSLEVEPDFHVDGSRARPYGVYTFSIRPKGSPDHPDLAAVSIDFRPGRSFTAVLQLNGGGELGMSVYENDFTPSANSRMTVRHTASPSSLTWQIAPRAQSTGPADQRAGTLGRGEWQVARDVTPSDYRFEAHIDGEVVAVHPDLELEHEKNRTVYVVGAPGPSHDPEALRRHVLQQEFQIPAGPALPDEVTAPAGPLWSADVNAPIEFLCDSLALWQTNAATTDVTAVDPDGVVTNLSVREVDPPAAGVVIPDHGVTPAEDIGGKAVARLEVLDDLPPGEYSVTVVANIGSLGHHATCAFPLTVRPITVDRLGDLVATYQGIGDITDVLAESLQSTLATTHQHLEDGEMQRACQDLKDLLDRMSTAKGKGITEQAHTALERETAALRANLGFG